MTRRDLLLSTFAVPLLADSVGHLNKQSHVEFIVGSHCLAEESSQGFKMLITEHDRSALIILPAVRYMTWETAQVLRRKAENGSWLLWESGLAYSPEPEIEAQRRILNELFGISVTALIPAHPVNEYVMYSKPSPVLIRPFGKPAEVNCAPEENLAAFAGHVVACRKRIGAGGITFLGSLLGTSLLSGDAEAKMIASHLLSWPVHCFSTL